MVSSAISGPNINSTLLGIIVALAVLVVCAVGSCVLIIACICRQYRNSRKQNVERYAYMTIHCLHYLCLIIIIVECIKLPWQGV